MRFSNVIVEQGGRDNVVQADGYLEDAMRFGATANSHQVEAMGHVVGRYCRHIGIERSSPEAEHIASLVLALHEVGLRGENELLKALIVPSERLPSAMPLNRPRGSLPRIPPVEPPPVSKVVCPP